MFHVFHDGFNNRYMTEGETPTEAWDEMRSLLERNHGGLATGMIVNCREFEDKESELLDWINSVPDDKRIDHTEVHSIDGLQEYGTLATEFSGPIEIVEMDADHVNFLDTRRSYISIRLTVEDVYSDQWGQVADCGQDPEHWLLLSDEAGFWCNGDFEELLEGFEDTSSYDVVERCVDRFPDDFSSVGGAGWDYFTYRPGLTVEEVKGLIKKAMA